MVVARIRGRVGSARVVQFWALGLLALLRPVESAPRPCPESQREPGSGSALRRPPREPNHPGLSHPCPAAPFWGNRSCPCSRTAARRLNRSKTMCRAARAGDGGRLDALELRPEACLPPTH